MAGAFFRPPRPNVTCHSVILNHWHFMVYGCIHASGTVPARRMLYEPSHDMQPNSGRANRMSQPRAEKVVLDELPIEIAELGEALNALPAELRLAISPLFNQVIESSKRRRRILSLVQ